MALVYSMILCVMRYLSEDYLWAQTVVVVTDDNTLCTHDHCHRLTESGSRTSPNNV